MQLLEGNFLAVNSMLIMMLFLLVAGAMIRLFFPLSLAKGSAVAAKSGQTGLAISQ